VSQPIRVLVVDDHLLFRRGVLAALASRPHIEVVGEAGNGEEAVQLARQTQPDVILMDIAMPVCSGLEATRQIKRELPRIKIIMLTVSEEDEALFEAVRAGAEGYLLKDLKVNQLFEAIESVVRGEAPLSGAIAAKLLRELQRSTPSHAVPAELTETLSEREIEILTLVGQGLSNKEIADRLYISESTVKNHLRTILDKLHLRNRIQAAIYASRIGLVKDVL